MTVTFFLMRIEISSRKKTIDSLTDALKIALHKFMFGFWYCRIKKMLPRGM